ncbi:MAG: mucoidy inhibitor MuiA family protein [Bacteroidota bacterium]|jgi:uncharacterized small protein (DUF1192 family)|nr:mucoidy inhibitor MuiA family protein [Cytophagales bacterium]MCE2957206.1 mucoidy inhibitor MuiA family protein [Flammeovirgaceae bacterium]MCZ8070345.1 mucoidy inhibitor MuiA family protein [Cytophagales bacterium]
MKAFTTLLLLLYLLAGRAQDNTLPISSSIKQATVFLDGAQVSRYGTAQLNAGVTTLSFKNLSPKVVEQSIQAAATSGVKILAVSFQLDYLGVKQKPERIALLEAEKKKLAAQLRQELSQEEVYKEEEVILKTNKSIGGTSKGVEVDQLKLAMDYFRQRLLEIKAKLFDIDKNVRKLNEEISRIDNQLKELNAQQGEESGTISVKVSTKVPTTSAITVKYLVKNAKWFPSYDIRAKDVQSPISVTYKANISQQSGEDWENVELTISSGNPMQSGERPSIQPWILGFNNHGNRILIRGVSTIGVQSSSFVQGRVVSSEDGAGLPGVNVVVKGTTVGTVTDAGGNYSLSLPAGANFLVFSFIGMQTQEMPIAGRSQLDVYMNTDANQLNEVVVTAYGVSKEKRSLSSAVTTITDSDGYRYTPPAPKIIAATPVVKQTNFEFKVDEPFSIKSDGETRATEMVEYELPAKYEYSCVPKLDPDAFLVAKVTGWDEYNFLEGEANLFFEGKFIGKSVLDTRNVNDTLKLSLGRDANVLVKREKVKNLSTKQLVGGHQKSSFTYEITVRNKKAQLIAILIEDQIPVPNTKEIDVEKIEDSKAEYKEETGLLKWKKQIPSGKTETIKLQYYIKYPKGSNMLVE